MAERKCVICGKVFETNHSTKTTCSVECRHEKNRLYNIEYRKTNFHEKFQKEMECEVCGKKFIAYKVNQKYCSRECYKGAPKPSHKKKTRAEKKPKEEDPYTCKRLDTCKYSMCLGQVSGNNFCGYSLITGELRKGFARDCDKYVPKKRRRRKSNEEGQG